MGAAIHEQLVTPRQRAWLYLVAGLVLLFLLVPMLVVIPMSFSGSRFLQFPPETWSLRWYRNYLGTPAWKEATRVSLTVAIATTLLATPLGVAAAYALHHCRTRWGRIFQVVLLAPLMVPIIIVAVGVFAVYARTGLYGTRAGLVLAHTMLALPFVTVATLAGLRSFDATQEMVARSLGMNRLRAFLAVTLPQIRASVVSGALFAFITSLDEVVIALFVSGGANTTLTKRMFTSLVDEIDPTIAAISSILMAVTLAMVLVLLTLGQSRARHRRMPPPAGSRTVTERTDGS